ncbi:MAG: preprotein translocase subunit SecA [Bacteroidia bacterium]|nr:preprotein translocase subunit SecA [Bacteroidia bacterium]
MLNNIIKGLSKIFGTKSEKDIKVLWPIVDKINIHFESLKSISNDELREQTTILKQRIAEHLSEVDAEIAAITAEIDTLGYEDLLRKDELYESIDNLEKERNDKLEYILLEILPEAFAVVKETARRFSENEHLEVTASDFDKALSVRKKNVVIDGNKAIYANTWDAAGAPIKWNMVHYDVQLIGGIVLHQGKISEMATGEGKTLVSTLPVYLNALTGRGVHLITVNDYLARRDCEWNGPLFEFHGLSVDCIDYHRPNSDERKKAYLSDITYGTNNEFGFDYLRDNMVHTPDELVQRKHHYAIVDEVDSVLVDDARTPLIISGPVPRGEHQEFAALKPRIEKLVEAQKKAVNFFLNDAKKLIAEGNTGEKEGEGGLALMRAHRGLPKNKAIIKFLGEQGMKMLLQKTENFYMADHQREMPKADSELYFVIDEKNNQVELTEKGVELITQSGEEKDFFIIPDVGAEIADIEKSTLEADAKSKQKEELMRNFAVKSERIHSINQLLKAYTLFEKDTEYILSESKVKIVDEQTGRVLEGRRYSDGLHQAIEAKENVKVEAASQTFATITLQNYFRMYHKLCGMTGTAETEAGEFWEIYKLDVVVIPTNRDMQRNDLYDLIYRTKREKYNAVIEQVVELTSAGRPVLVGTTSVEISELLSRMLKLRNIKHNVLNAKQNQREAEIIAEAGKPGAVTIATNMAGRGTDIKITKEVVDAGGLAILGTERHDSRRVDRQLRGRAGRQGDPGSSQFYVSLEDDLMRLFGSERASKLMDRFGFKEGEVIQAKMMSDTIERSQKKVEQNNFGMRKRLLEYDDVMNKQRTVIYKRRKNALFGDRIALDLQNMLLDYCEELVYTAKDSGDYDNMKIEVARTFAVEPDFNADELKSGKAEDLSERLFHTVNEAYQKRQEDIRNSAMPVLNKIWQQEGSKVENVAVPFTDGLKAMQVVTNLKKAIDSKGKELNQSFEKGITLEMIDEEWKDHLRELDELKQAANNATFEQKDPLLIYKLESFELFKKLISRLNFNVLSMLHKGRILSEQGNVQQAKDQRTDMSKMKLGRNDQPDARSQNAQAIEESAPVQQQMPIKTENLVGRNDLCPCGSGKKYKNCHGAV